MITLLTDFGLDDHYVGVMKGVIFSIAPEARVVDICHRVAAYSVTEGAYLLAQAWSYFPKGSVHVAVVDPGVGSPRRPILAETAGHYFVAPDNGLLSILFSESEREARPMRAWHITSARYFRHPVSQTFHGRDVFAPVAAHLARGVAPFRFGPQVEDVLRAPLDRPVRTARRGWTGAILNVDRFGNLITNFPSREYAHLALQSFEMQVGLKMVGRIAGSYAEIEDGELCLIAGSSGFFEVSVNQGSAAKVTGCAAGAPVEMHLL